MKQFFMISSGISKILAYIEKDAYTPDEIIKLRLELDNS